MGASLSLNDRRKQVRIGVGALARKAHLSRTTVWRVLAGKRDAYATTVAKIEVAIAAEERALAAALASKPREAA